MAQQLPKKGTRFWDADRAMQEIGLDMTGDVTEGAKKNLVDALGEQGFDTTDLIDKNLKNVSFDPQTMKRLTKIKDFYSMGEAPANWVKTVDDLTALWKSSILSWPARFTRDRYSGVFSNMLEVNNVG